MPDPRTSAWREYSGRVAWPSVVLAGATFTLWTAAVVLHLSGTWSTLAASIVSFLACYLALTVAHEAAHGNVGGRRHRELDAVVGWIAMFILLGPFPPFRELHLRHHAYTNHPRKDPDMWVVGTGPALVLRCATILPRYYWAYWYPPPGVNSQVAHTRRVAIGFFVGYGILISTMAWLGGGSTVIWVMMVPAWLALSFLAVVFDWLPHHPHLRQKRFLDTRAIPSLTLEVLLLGQNYHLVHHVWPAVPWHRYGALFRRTESLLRERGSTILD